MSVVSRDSGEGRMNGQSTKGFLRQRNYYSWYYPGGCRLLYIHQNSEYRTPRMNPDVNYWLWVIKVCQQEVRQCIQWTPLQCGADGGAGCMCMLGEGVNGNLYLLLNFAVVLKLLWEGLLKINEIAFKASALDTHHRDIMIIREYVHISIIFLPVVEWVQGENFPGIIN